MSTPKHTPGPWAYWPECCRAGGMVTAQSGAHVAAPTDYPGWTQLTQANALLIAAAPDLLEVLEEVAECAEYWSEYDVPLGIHDRIKAAIAKAKGEEVSRG